MVLLRRLFPTLAAMEPVKILALPLVAFMLLAVLGGLLSLLFGSRVID